MFFKFGTYKHSYLIFPRRVHCPKESNNVYPPMFTPPPPTLGDFPQDFGIEGPPKVYFLRRFSVLSTCGRVHLCGKLKPIWFYIYKK